jgi:hypothetical protein
MWLLFFLTKMVKNFHVAVFSRYLLILKFSLLTPKNFNHTNLPQNPKITHHFLSAHPNLLKPNQLINFDVNSLVLPVGWGIACSEHKKQVVISARNPKINRKHLKGKTNRRRQRGEPIETSFGRSNSPMGETHIQECIVVEVVWVNMHASRRRW